MTLLAHLLESRRSRISRWMAAGVRRLRRCMSAAPRWRSCTGPEEDIRKTLRAPWWWNWRRLPAATPVDLPDVAHGPLMEEAVLTPQATKQTVEEVDQGHTSRRTFAGAGARGGVADAATEERRSPRRRKQRRPVPEQQNPEQASAAPLTTAPPTSRGPAGACRSPRRRARSASLARVQASWQKRLINHLNRYKRYPDAARSHRAQGVVVVAFKLDRSGQLVASHVEKGQDRPALDEEALAMLKRASPLPAPPDQIARADA